MMKRLPIYCFFVSTVLFAQDISFLLPDSVGNWKKSGSAEIFIGDKLYELIDGGADIFYEYGFIRVITQRYSDSNENYIDVEMYEMLDSSAAYGIFSLFTFNTGKRVEFLNEAFAGDEFVFFRKGNYYVSLTGSPPSQKAEEGLVQISDAIDKQIHSSGKPPMVSLFDQRISNKTDGVRIAYIKGDLGLYNLSMIPFGKDFKVEEGICIEFSETKNFVFNYAGKDTCWKNYLLLVNNMKNRTDYSPVYLDKDSSLFAGQEDYFKCDILTNHILVSISENKTGAENAVKNIKNILSSGVNKNR